MSNFCGLVDFDRGAIEVGRLRRMATATGQLVQRTWEWLEPAVGLRLSSPAAERSAQLCTLQLPAGSLCLVGNLRLDNRHDLQRLLVNGSELATATPTDAQLLLAAYLRWGAECTAHLDGDFAFALWDGREPLLLCACDPLGVKPFYYAESGSSFCFASEVEPILQDPGVSHCLDVQTLANYLSENRETPGRTFFRDVRRLLPGHRLLVLRRGHRLEQYWQLQPSPLRFHDRRDYSQAFLEHFERAVTERLPIGEPAVGVAMSGGLDSSSIATLAQRQAVRASGPTVLAGTFTFDELTHCDERRFVAVVTQELGFEALSIAAEGLWFLNDRTVYSPSLASPSMAWEGCFHQLFHGMRQRGVRVLLTGHGGDHFLGGSLLVYRDRLMQGQIGALFEVARHARRQGLDVPRLLYRMFLQPALSPAAERLLRRALRLKPLPSPYPAWISTSFLGWAGVGRTSSPEPLLRNTASREIWELITRVSNSSQTLGWYDRLATEFGMEVRHPFLDRQLADFLLAIPPQELFQLGDYKPLLRRAMQDLLPEPIRLRPDKTGFGPFFDFSVLAKERLQVENLLKNSLAAELGILDERQLQAAYREYLTASEKEKMRPIWHAFTLEIWLRRHRDRLDFSNLAGLPPHRQRSVSTVQSRL